MSRTSWYFETVPVGAGLFFVFLSIRNCWRGHASRRWPSVIGRITRSSVAVDPEGDGGFAYTPKVEYEYAIEGTAYRGTRLQSGRISQLESGVCGPGHRSLFCKYDRDHVLQPAPARKQPS
jgi:Protein of unknown function (DUF3592).